MLRLLSHALWCALSISVLIYSSIRAVLVLSAALLFIILIVLGTFIILVALNLSLLLLLADPPTGWLLSIDLVLWLKQTELIRIFLLELWLRRGRFQSDWGGIIHFTQVCVGDTSCLLRTWIEMSVDVRSLCHVVDVHLKLGRLFDQWVSCCGKWNI